MYIPPRTSAIADAAPGLAQLNAALAGHAGIRRIALDFPFLARGTSFVYCAMALHRVTLSPKTNDKNNGEYDYDARINRCIS